MKRLLIHLGVALLLAEGFTGSAWAQGSAVSKVMKDLRWGMNEYEVKLYLEGRIKTVYQGRLKKASGFEKHQLEQEQERRIREIGRNRVEFDGRDTRWNSGVIKYEFTHNNEEFMLMVDDDNSTNFYFFIKNALWKWYKAYNPNAFAGQNFKQVSAALEKKFGRGIRKEAERIPGSGLRPVVEWRDRNTRVRAIDESDEYGRYCLVFEDLSTIGQLSTLRVNRDRRFAGLKPSGRKKTAEDDSDQSYETAAKQPKPQADDSKSRKSVFAGEARSETDEEYDARRKKVLEQRSEAGRREYEKKMAEKRAKVLDSLKGLESNDPISGM